MEDTLAIITKNNDRLRKVKATIKEYQHGHLSDEQIQKSLLPNIRFLDQIGAVGLFHSTLEALGDRFEDNIEYQICKMLDCYENFDHLGMAVWLNKINSHEELTVEQRAVVAINTIFANANGGCFDDYADQAISDLEDLVYNEHYLVFEGLENLMLELECQKDLNRLNRYVDFLEKYECTNWKECYSINSVLFNHYRRANDIVKQRECVGALQSGAIKFKLEKADQLKFNIYYLRLLFELRDGRWEDYSIRLFNEHITYLNADIDVAMSFIREFYAIVRDGAIVYGRHLNEKCILDITTAINESLTRFLTSTQIISNSFEPELLHSRRFWLELRKEQIKAEDIVCNHTPNEVLDRCKVLQNKILNICKINLNRREYIHWLLCFSDDLSSLSHEIDVSEELRDRAEQLDSLLKEVDYSPSAAYYLIFLANIWNMLGEEDKARATLQRFNHSGVNIKVYNLGVQKIYLSLEDKYRLLPNDERRDIIDLTTLLSDLNSHREIEEGIIRAERHFREIDVTNENYMVAAGPENVILFLLKCSHIFVNANRFDLADAVWDKYRYIADRWQINPATKAEFTICHATSLFRRERLEDAYKLTKDLQSQPIEDILKLRALIIMGDIEAAYSWPNFKINSLSEALAFAERLEIPGEIAGVYKKLGLFFSPYYPALGLSFIRKAEVIYENSGMVEELYETYLLRAQASMFIHLVYSSRYGEKTVMLYNEAERLLAEYPRTLYRIESSRAFHDRIFGILHCDVERLNNAILFYERVGAPKDLRLTLESGIIACSMNGKRNEALAMANQYLQIESEKGEELYIDHAHKMIDCLQQPDGCIGFPLPERPYPETTLLDILDEISFEEEIWALDKSPIRNTFPTYGDEGKCLLFKNGESSVLAPTCLLPFTYYRGQSERHDPCYPTLYRKNLSAADRFLARLRYCEFYLLLETHPMCNKFKNAFRYKYPDGSDEQLYLNVYHLELAQHYGIATELIDLTSDKWVAAFFAATRYSNGTYSPFDEEGTGVFYTCHETPDELNIKPIGLQPFSRPAEQRGYAMSMIENENFEQKVFSIREFKHYREINEFIFNFTNRSLKLFPDDVLANKAELIAISNKISKAAFAMAVAQFYPNEKEEIINEWMKSGNIEIVVGPITQFSEEDIDKYRRELPHRMKYFQENILVLNLGQITPDGMYVIHPVRNLRH